MLTRFRETQGACRQAEPLDPGLRARLRDLPDQHCGIGQVRVFISTTDPAWLLPLELVLPDGLEFSALLQSYQINDASAPKPALSPRHTLPLMLQLGELHVLLFPVPRLRMASPVL